MSDEFDEKVKRAMARFEQDLEMYETPKEELPDSAIVIDPLPPDFRNPPREQPNEPIKVAGGMLIVETAVTCLHCGQHLGEFRNGQRVMLQHPALVEGEGDFGLWLMEEDTSAGPEHTARKMGAWLRKIHEPPKSLPESGSKSEPILLRPETRRFKEVQPPDVHVQALFEEVIGDAVKQIAGLMHMVQFPGKNEQWTISLSDHCGFNGSIILRVAEVCLHEHGRREDGQGVPGAEQDGNDSGESGGAGESESTDTVHGGPAERNEPTPEERLLRAVFDNNFSGYDKGRFERRSRERDQSDDDPSGDEAYRHDPGDPAHDD